jgi:hypothetical protein
MSGVFSRSPTTGLPGSQTQSGLDPNLAALVSGAAFFSELRVDVSKNLARYWFAALHCSVLTLIQPERVPDR